MKMIGNTGETRSLFKLVKQRSHEWSVRSREQNMRTREQSVRWSRVLQQLVGTC